MQTLTRKPLLSPLEFAHHRSRRSEWRLHKGRKEELVKVRGAVSSNDGDVVMNLALEGHGIVQRSEWDAAKYLASGRLKEVVPAYSLPNANLHV